MRPTLREIARRADVHLSTASHVLNGSGGSTRVSHATRDRVLAAAQGMGYRANRAAQQLRTSRSHVVGLLTGDVENPFFARQVALCAEALENEGFDILLATRRRDDARDQHLLQTLLSHQLDGLLLWSEALTEVRETIQRPDLANTVVMGYQIPGRDCVYAETRDAISAAFAHLGQQGYRSIGYLAPRWALNRTGDPRHEAYREYIARRGQPPLILDYEGSAYDIAAPRKCAERLAASLRSSAGRAEADDAPDALFCFNDIAATGALMGLRRGGLRVPDDIALVGFDDLPLSAELDVPLTTIAYPLEEVCHTAVRLLIDRLRGTKEGDLPLPVRDIPVPGRLVVRQSSLRVPSDFLSAQSHPVIKGVLH